MTKKKKCIICNAEDGTVFIADTGKLVIYPKLDTYMPEGYTATHVEPSGNAIAIKVHLTEQHHLQGITKVLVCDQCSVIIYKAIDLGLIAATQILPHYLFQITKETFMQKPELVRQLQSISIIKKET